MTKPDLPEKPSNKTMTIEEEIAKTADKLRKLQDKQKELQRKERERCQKAVFDLMKSEKLDQVSVENWTKALPEIRKLLGLNQAKGVD